MTTTHAYIVDSLHAARWTIESLYPGARDTHYDHDIIWWRLNGVAVAAACIVCRAHHGRYWLAVRPRQV